MITKEYLLEKGKIKHEYYPIIKPYIIDKLVLDCGCAQHGIEHIKKSKKSFVHGFLLNFSKELIGIDINKKAVEDLNKIGFNEIKYMNVENMDFSNEYFDTIYAGELIEHLSNPGLFLENCNKYLKKKWYFNNKYP